MTQLVVAMGVGHRFLELRVVPLLRECLNIQLTSPIED